MPDSHPARKTITFGVPCYNSGSYMDKCIESILMGSGYARDVQVVIVDDGSTQDDTLERAHSWEERHPHLITVVHQENGGHGMAVLTALERAEGQYFKVVDSDDWLDAEALTLLLGTLRRFIKDGRLVDLVVTNYVYEHVGDGKRNVVDYRSVLYRNRVLTWDKIGSFGVAQYMLMHSLCYRTEVLRDGGLPLPAHTYYEDNIYSYVPLPRCKTLYYLDVDLYRYLIGRDDQSVNEGVAVSRLDHHIRVTDIMMKSYHLYTDVTISKLRSYMANYLTLMMAATNVYSKLSDDPAALDKLKDLWKGLYDFDPRMYRRARSGMVGLATNIPGGWGRKATIGLYRAAAKLVKFN